MKESSGMDLSKIIENGKAPENGGHPAEPIVLSTRDSISAQHRPISLSRLGQIGPTMRPPRTALGICRIN